METKTSFGSHPRTLRILSHVPVLVQARCARVRTGKKRTQKIYLPTMTITIRYSGFVLSRSVPVRAFAAGAPFRAPCSCLAVATCVRNARRPKARPSLLLWPCGLCYRKYVDSVGVRQQHGYRWLVFVVLVPWKCPYQMDSQALTPEQRKAFDPRIER